MYGELQVKPWELNRMTLREIVLAINGLRERDDMQQAMFRRMTAIIASTNMGGKGIAQKMSKLWPLRGDNISSVSDRAYATLKTFRENEALKKAKLKLDAGRT